MRGVDVTQDGLFTYTTLEAIVPPMHPLRPISEILNTALREMDRTFAAMYAASGRDSIPPEQLLRGLVLQALYGIRSERLLCEQARLQHAVLLVCRVEHGAPAVGSLDV